MKLNNLTIITLNSPSITDFAAARNAELAKAKTPWVLFLDTDETLSPELEQEIERVITEEISLYDAYYIPRKDIFFGRILKHGETGDAKFIRLAKKDYGKWVGPIHEVWIGEGMVATQTHPILHNSHPNMKSFVEKINRYSTIDAETRFQSGKKSSIWKIAVYPIAKFKWNFILKRGFLDGVPGLIMAIMMSFHSYLTWTKLFLLWRKNPERSRRI